MRGFGLALALMTGLLAGASVAQAGSMIISNGNNATTLVWSERPRADVVPPDLRTPEERAAREQAWLARCQPVKSAPNELGVQHYNYAAKGCEFGD